MRSSLIDFPLMRAVGTAIGAILFWVAPMASASKPSPSLVEKVDAAFSIRHFKVSELDVRPAIKTRTQPEFPLALNPGVKGFVVMNLLIDRKGAVERVEVVQSQPAGVFDDAAVSAFRKASFSPGMKAGQPVKVKLGVRVDFQSELPPATAPPVKGSRLAPAGGRQ